MHPSIHPFRHAACRFPLRTGAPHKTTSAARARKRCSAFRSAPAYRTRTLSLFSSVRRARALLSRAAVTSLRRFALSLRRRTAPRTGLRPRAGWLRLRAGAPTRRAAFGSRAARAAGPPAGGFAPFFLRGGERRTTPKICRLTKAARCAILHLDDRRKFALRRPEIGAYAEISRAFRCVYRVFTTNGAQISGCHAFCTEFCRCFHPVSARIRILPTQPRVSPELRAAHREGRPPSAHPLRRGHRAAVLSDKWKHSTT